MNKWQELINEIKKPGPVFIEIANNHDVFEVQAVKADLLALIERLREHEEADDEPPWEIYRQDGAAFVTKNYDY